MAKKYRKYNWDKLKKKYFESEIFSVRPFLEANYPTVNGHMLKKTTGWYKEKLAYEHEKQEQLLKLHMEKVAKSVASRMAREYKAKRLRELGIA